MKEIYFISVLSSIKGIMAVLGLLSLILLAILAIVEFESIGTHYKINYKKQLIGAIIVFVVSLLSIVFIPTRDEMYLMLGVDKVMEYVDENKKLQTMPEKIIEVIDKELDKELENQD